MLCFIHKTALLVSNKGKISTCTPPILNFRVRFQISVRFKIRARVTVRVRVGMVGLECIKTHIYI